MTEFAGKSAVIIGATSVGGIGEAVARDLAARGAKIIVAGRRLDAAQALAGEINGYAHMCDLTNEASIASLFDDAAATLGGGIDIVINAGGQAFAAPFAGIDADTLARSAQSNLIGPMLAMKHAARHLRRSGVFLQFSSIAATQPTPMTSPYAVFKAGLEHALRIAAVEYGAAGIRFLGIAPGIVITPMTDFIDNDIGRNAVTSVTPLGRMVSVADVAAMVRFLAGDGCFETGQVFPVTGGALLTRALLPQEFFV